MKPQEGSMVLGEMLVEPRLSSEDELGLDL